MESRKLKTINEFLQGLIEYAKQAGKPVFFKDNRIEIGLMSIILEADPMEADEIWIFDEETIWQEEDGLHYYNLDTGDWWFPITERDARVLYKHIVEEIRNIYVRKRKKN